MPRVVHFEISADEPERAVRFYADVFGWNTQKWDGPQDYWMVVTGEETRPGINGGIYKRHDGMSFNTHVNTIDVPSVDEFTDRIVKGGGRIVMPKFALPGVGHLAYCQDTEGNTFG
ncbi:MAG: VOC family protein, partial [Pyrinomonadaceae bacterium]